MSFLVGDLSLEIIRATLLVAIIVFLWLAGSRRSELSQPGWKLIIGGFWLLLFGSLLDITDNFESLNRFVVVGETQVQAILEKLVGFLGGFLLLAVGLVRWVPTVTSLESLRREVVDRKRSEKKYRDLVETCNDLIWAVDEEGRLTYVNRRAALGIYGYEAEEMLGRTFREFCASEEASSSSDIFAQVRAGKPVFHLESAHRHRSGSTIYLSFNAVATRDERGDMIGATGTASDITDHKRTEDVLRHNERLASIGTLAAGIAHEINNPLGIILLAAKRAEATTGKVDEGLHRLLTQIGAMAQRAGRIVDSVLKFAREGRSTKKPHNLPDVARRASDLVRPYAARQNVNVELDIPAHVPELILNVTEMEQVFVNLLHNAIESCDQPGRVVVRIRPAGDAIRVEVRDWGRGMTQEQLSRVFDPFYTTRQREGGTGLGLSITHGIVAQHDGVIDIRSTSGEGTVVTLVLPLQPPG